MKNDTAEKPSHLLDGWTEWRPLPREDLVRLNNEEHLRYCELYMKAHPGLGNGMSYDEFKKNHEEYLKGDERNDKFYRLEKRKREKVAYVKKWRAKKTWKRKC